LPTACVAACSMRIIFTGTTFQLSQIAAERAAKTLVKTRG
jgi:hypothetical protein